MSEFKFAFDTGRVIFIRAKTRKSAIEKFCEIYGIPKDWVKQRCKIVRMGVVKDE